MCGLEAKYWWEDWEEGHADGKCSHDIPRLTFWGNAWYDHKFDETPDYCAKRLIFFRSWKAQVNIIRIVMHCYCYHHQWWWCCCWWWWWWSWWWCWWLWWWWWWYPDLDPGYKQNFCLWTHTEITWWSMDVTGNLNTFCPALLNINIWSMANLEQDVSGPKIQWLQKSSCVTSVASPKPRSSLKMPGRTLWYPKGN